MGLSIFQIPGDIRKVQEERTEAARRQQQTLQPYLLVVGQSMHNLDTKFVCVDDILYGVPSLLEALDVCFKGFHVFNAKYPPESCNAWTVLQRALYNFSTKWDVLTSTVYEILHDLNVRKETPRKSLTPQ